MTGRSLLRRAKKVVSRAASCSRAESISTPDSSCTPLQSDTPSTSAQATPSTSAQATGPTGSQLDEGVWLIDATGTPLRRRGRTTCADIQALPPGTRVHLEINENGIPCNFPESILLGSFLGVVARDPSLAPISFKDWRNKGLDPFKKKILAEVEGKFEFPLHIRPWILQSVGVKWRNFKTNLKAEFWDKRSLEEILENVPNGVDAAQWSALVTQWTQPEDKARADQNTQNVKKQTTHHTMGRVSSVRRRTETGVDDRLLLWKLNRLRKDGTWTSDDARLKWEHAVALLAEEGLTPEDGNLEANERIFVLAMGPEHPGRVRTQGFGVTPTRFFPQSTHSPGQSSGSSRFGEVAELRGQMSSMQTQIGNMQSQMQTQISNMQAQMQAQMQSQMDEFMTRMSTYFPAPGGSNTGESNQDSDA